MPLSAPAVTAGAGYGGTSTSSVSVAVGSKSFTTQAGMAYKVGARMRATATADASGATFVEGLLTAYSDTAMTLVVDLIGANGGSSYSSWNLNLAGQTGSTAALPIDTDGAMAANSDAVVPSQKATRTYAAAAVGMAVPMANGQIVASVAGSELTVAIKTLAGADPSTSDPVICYFRSATLSDGAPVKRTLTSALSLTVPSTATMGFVNAVPGRLWVTLIDTGADIVIGLQNCSAASAIYPLDEAGMVSTTIMSASSDNAGVMYSAAAQASKAFRIVGLLTWETAMATAGTWSAGPDVNQLFGPGVRKPGDIIQLRRSTTSAQTSTTSASYVDTGLTDTISLSSAVNKVRIAAAVIIDNVTSGKQARMRLHRGATAIGSEGQNYTSAGGESIVSASLIAFDTPGTVAATTYTAKLKNLDGVSTVYFNTNTIPTEMQIEEMVG